MVDIWLGVAGLVLILLGWIPQTIETIKKGFCPLSPAFAVLYALGSIALTLYAYQLNDAVFLILNGFAAIMALINIFYVAFPRPAAKKKRK